MVPKYRGVIMTYKSDWHRTEVVPWMGCWILKARPPQAKQKG